MRQFIFVTLVVCLATAWPQEPSAPSLRGVVTDPSGASVPSAGVQLRGPGGVHRATTDRAGNYSFPDLRAGKYQLRIAARGFAAVEHRDLRIDHAAVVSVQLAIQAGREVVRVDDGPAAVSTEPGANGGALVLRERQLAALSDDPEELALQLQALAGPAPGPDGGQMFIDGFTGGNLPPKSAIREIRINSNPFSPEYDRPGFARVEIFTKPGSDSLHGQAFAQFNGEFLNSRNPLLAQSDRPRYRTQFYGFDATGPLKRNRASFTFDAEHRRIDENDLILATTLDDTLSPLVIDRALAAPQTRTTIAPRIDYAFNAKNTLTVRYQEVRVSSENQGAGDFNLESRAYRETQAEHTVQATETAVISPRLINETRVQYLRSTASDRGVSTAPVINVLGAFTAGGATIGDSGNTTGNWEATNTSTLTSGRHTIKWGGRVRLSRLTDTSRSNFAGTFTFYTLAQYQQTLRLQQAGYSAAEIASLGSGPSQFSLNAGIPAERLSQIDAGLFVNDDWRVRPNLTLSAGLRYEAQNNWGDAADWAPRVAIAWGLDGRGAQPAKTVVRAGAGIFYDRIPLSVSLNERRYDGITQNSYLILQPTFFPEIPSADALQAAQQTQQLRPVYRGIDAPRIYQASAGIERQLGRGSRVTLTWIHTRGAHLLNSRNINTPMGGVYPFGDRSIRLLTESAGYSRQNQLVANTNATYRKVMLFGMYALSYGRDNNEGLPADPYNLRAEWGPSNYGDMRHRAAIGSTVPLLWRFSVSPFLVANSGVPYNITTGLDPLQTGFPAARPQLLSGVAEAGCAGSGMQFAPGFGCFNLNPMPGSPVIGRNFGRGPSAVNLVLRISRTWAFGGEGRSGPMEQGSHGGGGMPAGGPPPGMFGTSTGRKYNLTLSASSLNALNHPNFAPPNGDLSSPYFGAYRSLGGLIVMSHGAAPSTYNRKIDLQLRLTF